MKTGKRFIISLLIFILLMVSSKAYEVNAADHYIPGSTSQKCNNTYRSYSHTSSLGSINQGSHTTSSGSSCTILGLIFMHSVSCTSCGASFGQSGFCCTTAHTVCHIYIENH